MLSRRTAIPADTDPKDVKSTLVTRASVADLGFVLPAVVLIGLVMVLPGVVALTMSLFRWSPGFKSPFVGLDNYVDLLTSEEFHAILGNQGVLLLGVPLWSILPLLVAFVLYERVPFAGLFRTVYFFPAILSPAIVGILFRAILAPDGVVNELLRSIGLGALVLSWLDDATIVKPTLILVLAWQSLGLGVVIFSSALAALDPQQLDAAQIDGASWLQRLRHVVIPEIRGTIIVWT